MTNMRLFTLGLAVFMAFTAPVHAKTYSLVTTVFKPFTDPENEKGGFLVEIARQALKTQGHDITVEYRPWARALTEAANGKYDGLLSAFYNTERAQSFHFSAPLNTTKMVFISLKETKIKPVYASLDDLSPYRIAIGRKWAYSPEFENHKNLNKSTVNTEPQGIKLLFSKRVDLFAVNYDQFYAALAQMPGYSTKDIKVLNPAISRNDQHIAATKRQPNSEEFLADFNTGLAALKANGDYWKIRQSFFGF
jgi:polar amino acid transport system substrate-binding protein